MGKIWSSEGDIIKSYPMIVKNTKKEKGTFETLFLTMFNSIENWDSHETHNFRFSPNLMELLLEHGQIFCDI